MNIVNRNNPTGRTALPIAGGLAARLASARLVQSGLQREPLLKKARLTVRQIEDRTARFSVQSQIKFLDLAAASLRDEFLGFHIARSFDPREIGLFYYVLASSDVLGDALQRAIRYSTTVNESISLSRREGNDLAIIFNYVGIARHSDRHQIEFWAAALVRACRDLTGRDLFPRRVTFTHHRHEDCSELDAFFGTKVEFGAAVDEVAFPASFKEMPVISADPYLHRLLVGYCEEVLVQRGKVAGTLRADIENEIAPLLPHGKARLGEVARMLGTSQRTLARRLAAERLTFSAILNELRLDLARRHVADSSLSISQIAWLLGFQEVSAFTHAFKRWTGKTPRQMRTERDSAPPAAAQQAPGSG